MIKDSWLCKKVRGLGFSLIDGCLSDKMKAEVLDVFTKDIQTISIAEEILRDDESGFCVASEMSQEVTLCHEKVAELELKVVEMKRVLLLQPLHIGMLKKVVSMHENKSAENHSNRANKIKKKGDCKK